ncbi:hypothetical protein SAMN02744778_00724 [Pantoea sp. GL120224-02]|nr:hypothetical protein SAMN02744778_00724 [Pantoea sp. GL120224-02]
MIGEDPFTHSINELVMLFKPYRLRLFKLIECYRN